MSCLVMSCHVLYSLKLNEHIFFQTSHRYNSVSICKKLEMQMCPRVSDNAASSVRPGHYYIYNIQLWFTVMWKLPF